ncbi:MAG: hypothetical protein AB7Y46_03445 [Armatimonadota bacterium]
MSLKDLHQAGVLLPRDEWGVHDLHTSVNKPMLVAALLVGLASVVLMYVGAGGTLTFVAVGLFIGFMAWITHVSVKAVNVQAAQFAEERQHFREEHPIEQPVTEADVAEPSEDASSRAEA